MKEMWHHEMGSFGEETSEYRELKFFFDEKKKDDNKTVGKSVVSILQGTKPSAPPASTSSSSKNSSSINSPKTPNISGSSRRSRSRAKRHKALQKRDSKTNRTPSPDRQSCKKDARPDQDPIKLSEIKVSEHVDSTGNETFYQSFPKATSTPKSPASSLNSSVLESKVKNSMQKTPDEGPSRRGAMSIRERSVSRNGDNEIDLDKSLSLKKPSASKNLASLLEKKEEARKTDVTSSMISSKPPTSPGTSVYMYNTGSANSTFMSAKDLHKERVAASTGPRSASKSPKGTLRVKETKVIREVRQEDGKPPEISEKKEETVKEEKVNLSERLRARSRASSPATPTLKRTFNQTDESNIVTLSAG